jgi:predicted GNAT family acetyltransferase
MRQSDPDFWGQAIPEDISMDPAKIWIGIKQNNEIVAITGFWAESWIGCIAIVATLPKFQNQGYATVLVSNALQTIFKKAPEAIIHVRDDNVPALRTYQKVGFKPFLEYVLIK